MNKIPELLSPAGDPEKMRFGIAYGADAVYMAGQRFGMRAAAANFDDEALRRCIAEAHAHGVKCYITVNIMPSCRDLPALPAYLELLQDAGADAMIVADVGVIRMAQKYAPKVPLHISTQTSILNPEAANFWADMGAERVVLARELSLEEIAEIRAKTPKSLEIEAFVHGAMCISYSGRCLLSNYLAGRDANKGACAHPCRWKYHLVEETRPGEYMPIEENERGTYIYNSKDLCMIEHIPDIAKAGIYSLKIEGRMKTPFYVGTVVKAYRQAIDDYFADPKLYEERLPYYLAEVSKASHRDYTTAFYYGKPDGNQQVYTNNSYIREYDFIGMVQEDWNEETGFAWVEQRNKFSVGEEIEVMPAQGDSYTMKVTEIRNQNGETVASAPHPQELLQVKFEKPVKKFDMLRKRPSDVK
mgnify:CR=1 FL=1